MIRSIILILIIIIGCRVNAQQEKSFIIKGTISGVTKGNMNLYYRNAMGKNQTVTQRIKNGTFLFKGNINEIQPAQLYYTLSGKEDYNEINVMRFYMEPTIMNVKLTINKFADGVLTGSATQTEYTGYKKLTSHIFQKLKPYYTQLLKLNREINNAHKQKKSEQYIESLANKYDSIKEALKPYNDEIQNISMGYFADHPNSIVTVNELRFYTSKLSSDSLEFFYNRMDRNLQESYAGKSILSEINYKKRGMVGILAENFVTTDVKGNRLQLADFKGKYVLLDFWASWCSPCRKANPHLREIYKKYNPKGLEIIGIADNDTQIDEWKKAIEKDSIGSWHQVLRGANIEKMMSGEDNENDISIKYGINELPTKILINRLGFIIGRYQEGNDDDKKLDDKLSELLK